MEDVSTCILFVRETPNESLRKNDLQKIPVTNEKTGATTVSNVYKRNLIEALKKQIQMRACAALLQLRTTQ